MGRLAALVRPGASSQKRQLKRRNHRWTQINTDADPGEGAHLAGEAGLLGIRLLIRVHLCSSVVELLFLGSSQRPRRLDPVTYEDFPTGPAAVAKHPAGPCASPVKYPLINPCYTHPKPLVSPSYL